MTKMMQTKVHGVGWSGRNFTAGIKCRRSTSDRIIKASAWNQDLGKSFNGVYGEWKIEQKDLFEVWSYRISISIIASAVDINTASELLHIPNTSDLCTYSSVLGAGALGIALTQIHIYVTEIKRVLQAFWLLGVIGGTSILLQHSEQSPIDYVIQNPQAVWYIGPLFASLSGICFKEGLCYGKAEAFILSALIPVLLLGHLTGWIPHSIEEGIAAVIAVLLSIFALRKYTQPVKDDIGDGSVFRFQAMTEEEQVAYLKKLRDEGEKL